jgi:hypothetical protein
MVKANKKAKGHTLSKKLAKVRVKEADAIRVASDVERVLKKSDKNSVTY